MKTYLEYQDEKSHKFWEITLNGNEFTTRYGKVGADGQSKTKTFDSEEKAEKEYDKLVKQKQKKGYAEVDNTKISEDYLVKMAKIYSYDDFKKLGYDMENVIHYMDDNDNFLVAVIDGDITIRALDGDYLFGLFDRLVEPNITGMVWFTGKITIETLYMEDKEDMSRSLVFANTVNAKNVIAGGILLNFLDKLTVSRIYYIQIRAEGSYYLSETAINVFVDASQEWIKDGKTYDLSEMSEDLTAKNLDEIFIKKEDYFEINEDEEDELYYEMEIMDTENKFIEDIFSGKKMFKD